MATFIGTNLAFYAKTGNELFHEVATTPLDLGDNAASVCGWIGDVDGNGLGDYYACSLWNTGLGLDVAVPATMFGGGEILLPTYPYPITTNDLPAHFTGRALDLGLRIAYGKTLMKVGLTPNGTLDLKVGPPQSDGRAPLLLLADTFHMPDTPNGNSLYRVEPAGRDGSGWITVSGANAGQLNLEMDLRVSILSQATAPGAAASDTVRVLLTADPPMNFNTGFVRLKGQTKMPNFLAAYGLGSTLTLQLDAYVDYVSPAPQPSLVRLPATLRFPTRNAGAPENVQTIWLCNFSEQDLRIDSLTTPAADNFSRPCQGTELTV